MSENEHPVAHRTWDKVDRREVLVGRRSVRWAALERPDWAWPTDKVLRHIPLSVHCIMMMMTVMIAMMIMVILKRIPQHTFEKRSSLGRLAPVLNPREIWRIWERNTEPVREKYISTNLWQIESQVVRNTIQRTNDLMLVWTEIPRQLQITVQMQAQIHKYKYTIAITQIQIQTQIQIRSDDGVRTIVSEIKFWWILAFTECESDTPFRSYDSLDIPFWGPIVRLEASQQMKNWKKLNFWQNSNL